MRVNKTRLTPMIGKIYYDTYATTIFKVDVTNKSGTQTSPFIAKVDGISSYEDLKYNNETNCQRTINIVFDKEPSNPSGLLSSFYIQLVDSKNQNIGNAIQVIFVNILNNFPINAIITLQLNLVNLTYNFNAFVNSIVENKSTIDDRTSVGTISYTLQTYKDITFYNNVERLDITIPSNVQHGFYAVVNLKSYSYNGHTTTINFKNNNTNYPLKLIVHGVANTTYQPVENVVITLSFANDGFYTYCYVNEI